MRNIKRNILLATVFLLAFLNGGLYYMRSIEKRKLNEMQHAMDTLMTKKSIAESTMKEFIDQMEVVRKNDKNKIDTIKYNHQTNLVIKNTLIKQLAERIQKIEGNTKIQIKKAEQEIKKSNANQKALIGSLEEQKKKMHQGVQNNRTIVIENNNLKDSIEKQRQRFTILEGQKMSVEEAKKLLEKRLSKASYLAVADIECEGYFVKSNGKEKSTNSANKATLERICMTVRANPITIAGEETIHVRVISPSGQTLVNEAENDYIFDESSSQKIRYSTKVSFYYSTVDKELCFDWIQEGGFEKGYYILEFYNKGYPCGKGTFNLK